jgi:hypothetical protein
MQLLPLKSFSELEKEYLERNKRTFRVSSLLLLALVALAIAGTLMIDTTGEYHTVPCHEPTGANP